MEIWAIKMAIHLDISNAAQTPVSPDGAVWRAPVRAPVGPDPHQVQPPPPHPLLRRQHPHLLIQGLHFPYPPPRVSESVGISELD